MTIRNPVEWSADQLVHAGRAMGSGGRAIHHPEEDDAVGRLAVRRINAADLKDVLLKGLADFAEYRTDVIFLCVIYPLAGLVLAKLAMSHEMLPMVFPLASGFALLGPLAAVGLYEMSRRREEGHVVGWEQAFGVLSSPSFGAIAFMGLLLMGIFLLWLVAAQVIYQATLGPLPPASIESFLHAVFTTPAGWAMIVVGMGVGFLFAALVLSISLISFPLLLDRKVGVDTAVATSVRAVIANPRMVALWGLIVAGGLVLGSLPLLIGLVFVVPILGHATWHLYRKLIPR